MRMLTRACTLAAIGLLGLAPTATASPTTSHPQPISGTTSGADTYASPATCPEGATWRFINSSTGWVSHLGRVTATNTHCTFASDGVFSGGETTITAANGDDLFMTYSGSFVLDNPTNPTRSDIELTWQIVGGTGRFEHAKGTGTGTGFGLISGWDSTTTMNYDGTISTALGSLNSN